ncbi:hypothetical protein NITMOv2_2351 [Nitrospira moscoviensis]|uniref:Uncharacterized protein n=1 Tax=Nitrospira moscoviensis TaxID=42253 RepID=A0A0K2GCT0_NITMO|nr:hypothetical protein NITMOv2_2351 [Nitrospira moscoviensis]
MADVAIKQGDKESGSQGHGSASSR